MFQVRRGQVPLFQTKSYQSNSPTVDPSAPKVVSTGAIAKISWEKMSKSKFNGVDPLTIIERYGVDATRLFILSKAAPQDELQWDESGIVGMERLLTRIKALVHEYGQDTRTHEQTIDQQLTRHSYHEELRYQTHLTIDQVTKCFTSSFAFNVAISYIIKLVNSATDAPLEVRQSGEWKDAVVSIVKLLAPFAPIAAQEFWKAIAQSRGRMITSSTPMSSDIFDPLTTSWCQVDKSALNRSTEPLIIMINGKARGAVEVSCVGGLKERVNGDGDAEFQRFAEETARQSEIGQRWLKGKVVKKVILTKSRGAAKGGGRAINFVLLN